MIFETDDLRIAGLRPLIPPAILMEELPIGEKSSATVAKGREQIQAVLRGDDDRLLVVVGPCSVHDPVAAIDYAHRLREAADRCFSPSNAEAILQLPRFLPVEPP